MTRPSTRLGGRRLKNAKACWRIFTEQLSGAVTDRPALREALEFARSGNTLIAWKLDRLARAMKQLIETIEELRLKGIGFRRLNEALDTTTAQGRLVFYMVWHVGGIRAQPDPRAHPSGPCRRAARWPYRRPAAETDRPRHLGRQGDAAQSRHRRDSNRAPPRCLSGNALSVHPCRPNCEYSGRLRTNGSSRPFLVTQLRIRNCSSCP
jgi:hypothetical protein